MATEVLDKGRSVAAVAVDYRCGWRPVHVMTVAHEALVVESAPVTVLGIDETRR